MINPRFKPFNEPLANVSEDAVGLEPSMTDEELTTHRTIKELANEDQPREKLLARGVGAMTDAELLAILIGGGTSRLTAIELAQQILRDCGGRLRELNRMSLKQLMRYDGIGEVKALTLIAAAELGRRRAIEVADQQLDFHTAKAVHEYMLPRIQDLSHEESWALLLNNKMELIYCAHLSVGGLTETAVDVRVLLKEALLHDATGFILVHNHPSGSLKPSRMDCDLTEMVRKASETMRIRMLDHTIVADTGYYSFNENGKL